MRKRFDCQSAPIATICSTCGKPIFVGDRCVVLVRFLLEETESGAGHLFSEDGGRVDFTPDLLDVQVVLPDSFRFIAEPVVTRHHGRGCGVRSNTSRRPTPGDCGRGKKS